MKSWSLFQNPPWKLRAELPGREITMTIYPACNKTSLSWKPAYQIKSYYGTLSKSHCHSFRIRQKKGVQRPLAEDLLWRHILLAMKPHYLWNHASQIKSYYGSLSCSHGQSFRIRHEKVRATPPCGGLTVISGWQKNPLIKKLIVNGVSHSHKTANIFFIWLSSIAC